MDIHNKPSSQECLVHHGVKGMRWGVRRYQNYDGSYTQRGLERYPDADKEKLAGIVMAEDAEITAMLDEVFGAAQTEPTPPETTEP